MRQHRKFVDIKSQSLFCEALMCRLNYDIQNSAEGSWSGMENHTQKQNDIVRLRRELLELSKMLDPWRKDGAIPDEYAEAVRKAMEDGID